MRAPAVVLRKGTRMRIFSASLDEVHTLPQGVSPVRVLRSYELQHLNLSTVIIHYRLRNDGALVLDGTERIHCAMCYLPEKLDLDEMRGHLRNRAHSIRKLLRDRRIIVEMKGKTSVLSCDTLKVTNSLN